MQRRFTARTFHPFALLPIPPHPGIRSITAESRIGKLAVQLSPVGALFDIERPSSTAGVGCATGPDGGGWLGGSLLRRGWRASTSAQTWSPHPRSSCSAARPCRPSSTEQPGVCKASVRSEAIKPDSTRVVSPVTYEDSRLGAPAPHCIPATSPRRMRQGGQAVSHAARHPATGP
jgi:hypothetical protein